MKQYTQRVEASPMDTPPIQPIYINSGGTAVVIIIMFLFSLVVLGIVYRDSASAIVALVATAPVFLFGTPLLVLSVNGGITRIVCSQQEQTTIRRYNDSMVALQLGTDEQRKAFSVETIQPALLTADGLQRDAMTPRYIPAVARVGYPLKAEAAGWVTQLFDTSNGRPLPNRITPNKKQIQLKSPEDDIAEYLFSLGMITEDERKHLYFNISDYPTLRDALNAIRTGVRASGKVSENNESGV